jgi:hypothetical protein
MNTHEETGEIICDKCVDKTYKKLPEYAGIKIGDVVMLDIPGSFLDKRPAMVTAFYTHELLSGKMAALVEDASGLHATRQFAGVAVKAESLKKGGTV